MNKSNSHKKRPSNVGKMGLWPVLGAVTVTSLVIVILVFLYFYGNL